MARPAKRIAKKPARRPTKRRMPRRRSPARDLALRWLPPGGICGVVPACAEFEVDFKDSFIRLVSIELYDPNKPGDVWVKVPYAWTTALADKAAKEALDNALFSSYYFRKIQTPCQKVCTCTLSGKWGRWSRWQQVSLSANFSTKAPDPPPALLHYRATGTTAARFRMQIGSCRK